MCQSNNAEDNDDENEKPSGREMPQSPKSQPTNDDERPKLRDLSASTSDSTTGGKKAKNERPKLRNLSEGDEDQRQLRKLNEDSESESLYGLSSLDSETIQKRKREYMDAIVAEEERISPSENVFGIKSSHELVTTDEDGMLPLDKFVYVEETECIGCQFCHQSAFNTFYMEPEHGRARVFNQLGDREDVIEEAINTCPVNCIYYVNWADLVTLELERKNQSIENMARLVGGQDFAAIKKKSRKSTALDSAIMRCEDCPGRGCAQCPLFGVGENPEYLRKKKMREAKQAKKKKDEDKNVKRRISF